MLMYGWPLCPRSTYRFIDHFETVPRFIRGVQRFTPFFKSGIDSPKLEAHFEVSDIALLEMGCGFLNVVDEMNRVYSWGDNYGSQLGTKDDIHRDEPAQI